MKRTLADIDWKVFGSLLAVMVPVTLLWHSWAVYPLRILVVFFHELSHGLAAVLSGGSIVKIEVVAQEGGLCLTRGGNRFLTLTAGYLGSLAWGGVILTLAARTRWDKRIAVGLGAILVLVSLLWVRPVASFGFGFGMATGVVLVAVGIWLSETINDYLLRLIGLTSCLYAVLDIKSDILDRPQIRSDAYMLAEHTGLPTLFWGVLWIVLAVAAALFFLVIACRRTERRQRSRT